jgi:hypothetical protein
MAGTLTPPVNGTSIIINYTRPDGRLITHEILTGDNGNFTASLTPDTVGTWVANLVWPGNDEYLHTSSQVTFTVQDSGIPVPSVLIISGMLAIVIVLFIRRR